MFDLPFCYLDTGNSEKVALKEERKNARKNSDDLMFAVGGGCAGAKFYRRP
jgi:hypothetical protein